MGSKKSFVKGVAAGAVLGAVFALVTQMKKHNVKKDDLEKAGKRIQDKVAKHAKKLGRLSKQAYGKIVDTTVAEVRGVKALSEDDLMDLRDELKDGWSDIQKMFMDKKGKK